MRVLLDTNVLIAAFISRGTCNELLEHCSTEHDIISSEPLLQEFRKKLQEKFHYTEKETKEAEKLLKLKIALVEPALLAKPICRDPDDDIVIASAIAGNCRYIITGDKDLLILKRVQSVDIIDPKMFWKVS